MTAIVLAFGNLISLFILLVDVLSRWSLRPISFVISGIVAGLIIGLIAILPVLFFG